LVTALREADRLDEADRMAEDALELFEGFTDLVFQKAWIARSRRDDAGARALFQRCLEMGDAPSRYSSVVGCGTYLSLIALAQLSAGSEAEGLLARCLEEHPHFLGAVHPYAAAMLANRREAEDVVATIEERVEKITASVRFMLGVALYEAGAAAVAAEQFRSVLEQQPDSVPGALPIASAQLLTTTLEALLRLCEVDAFGMLVPLIERVGLPPRDRRELLASMYMRRGYLESAADEWISVIQELGPDAPALTGLALVAKAREMPEDALVFAREARALDPGYAAASQLVTSLEVAA
jgi:tetratricopeptide (TPR) repeat protein